MSRILVIAEHDGRHLQQSTARCLNCARQIDAAGADVAVFAAADSAVPAEAAQLAGVKRVLLVAPAASGSLAAVLAPQIVALAGGYDCILAPSTTFGRDLMPRVAALLGAGQVSDIMAVIGPRSFKRPIYAGNAIITVEVPEGQPVIGTVRSASFKPVENGAAAPVETVAISAEIPAHTRFIELQSGSSDRPDLQSAKVVLSGGRGLGSADNFSQLFALAERMGAAVGASRAAVDAGFVPNEMQVGQTGKIIAPEFYLAFGISGAIQHLTGIKDAGTIVAINKDAEAPIFEVADIGLVGDLFATIEEINKQLG
ncbi:MAG: electron transfer flavoprotein subunit alpha/FixB family protein [Gammaproteobacteria bacterium]|nr:electron transfer flavoprotein subunit alpha/FixB family protein [Gammaproteobacteria bacterium]